MTDKTKEEEKKIYEFQHTFQVYSCGYSPKMATCWVINQIFLQNIKNNRDIFSDASGTQVKSMR